MEKCYNIKTWEDITDRITIGAKEDCIFIVHKDGAGVDFFTDSGDFVEEKLSTFEMLERMIDHDDACRNSVIKQSTPTDPVLAKFCEFTRAKMYDDYVMFDESIFFINSYRGWSFLRKELLALECEDYSTIFEEYSKHLRNEENKFEAINKLLNLDL